MHPPTNDRHLHPRARHGTAPRILLVAKDGLLTWQHSLLAAFTDLGLEAKLFRANPKYPTEYVERLRRGNKHLFNRPISHRLRTVATRFQPDLILSLVGMFPRDLLQELDHRPHLAVWLCDTPVRPFDAHLHEQLDAFFAFDSSMHARVTPYLRTHGRIVPLPLAFDPRQYHRLPDATNTPAVLFAGTCTAQRRTLVEGLRAQGVPVKAVGLDWPRRLIGLRQNNLSHTTLNRLLNSYTIALNHQQRQNTLHGLNLRVFEATGAGTFLLTPDVPDLPACFEPGREVAAYHSPEELAELAHRGMKDTPWARRIAEAGHQRALAEHTFAHRARTIARHFGWI